MTPQQLDNISDMYFDARYYAEQVAQVEPNPQAAAVLVVEFLVEDYGITTAQAEQIVRM